MNTNSNIYTVIYTTIVVVIVAAALAFVSQKLGPMQAANEKAETISQILTAAQFGDKEHWREIGNAKTIEFFEENIDGESEVTSTAELKALNYKIKAGEDVVLPVYTFKNGITVVAVYGAGLWGPVWGYIALQDDMKTIAGAYFDHESETPGLGGKIKDDPSFRNSFEGKLVDFADEKPFGIIKGGVPEGKTNAVDAITGATMTSKGLSAAIENWLKAYRPQAESLSKCVNECECEQEDCEQCAEQCNMEDKSNE